MGDDCRLMRGEHGTDESEDTAACSNTVIAPSILSADFACLLDECRKVLPPLPTGHHCPRWLHVDVMDGHFVPNLTIGPPVVKCLRRHLAPDVHLDCHMMVTDPLHWVKPFKEAGATSLTFHYESVSSPNSGSLLIDHIRQCSLQVGISVKPATPIADIHPFLPLVDIVLVMTVEPGFGGQPLIEACLAKIVELREIRRRDRLAFLIEVDGGVTQENCSLLASLGADVLVAGSAIFGHADPKEALLRMQQACITKRG